MKKSILVVQTHPILKPDLVVQLGGPITPDLLVELVDMMAEHSVLLEIHPDDLKRLEPLLLTAKLFGWNPMILISDDDIDTADNLAIRYGYPTITVKRFQDQLTYEDQSNTFNDLFTDDIEYINGDDDEPE